MKDMDFRIRHMDFLFALLAIAVVPVTLFGADEPIDNIFLRILPLALAAIIWFISKKKKNASRPSGVKKSEKPDTSANTFMRQQTRGRIERQYKPIEPK